MWKAADGRAPPPLEVVDTMKHSWNKTVCVPGTVLIKNHNWSSLAEASVVDLGGVRGVHLHPPLGASNIFLRT